MENLVQEKVMLCTILIILNYTDTNTLVGLYMGPNNLCYVTHHFLFIPYVAMSLFIRP